MMVCYSREVYPRLSEWKQEDPPKEIKTLLQVGWEYLTFETTGQKVQWKREAEACPTCGRM